MRDKEKKRITNLRSRNKRRKSINAKRRLRLAKERKIVRTATIINQTIGNVVKKPNYNLWNGEGQWSEFYDICKICRTNTYKYKTAGLCYSCYMKEWYKVNRKKILKKLKKANKKRLVEQRLKWRQTAKRKLLESKKTISMVKDGKIKVPKKIENLLYEIDN